MFENVVEINVDDPQSRTEFAAKYQRSIERICSNQK